MSPRTPYPPPDGMPALIAVELNRLENQCNDRHDRHAAALSSLKETVIAHDRRLVEQCGESGKNGELGRMKIDILDNEERSRTNEKGIEKLKSERRMQLAWSAGGATTGGGAVIGLIELARYLF